MRPNPRHLRLEVTPAEYHLKNDGIRYKVFIQRVQSNKRGIEVFSREASGPPGGVSYSGAYFLRPWQILQVQKMLELDPNMFLKHSWGCIEIKFVEEK